jgi:hypothetical protein
MNLMQNGGYLFVPCLQAVEAEHPGAVAQSARNIDTGDLPLTVREV